MPDLSVLKRHSVLLSIVLTGLLFARPVPAQTSDIDEAMKKLRILTSVLLTIQENYVDPDAVQDEDLINGAIHGMVETLDRYSVYMEPEEAQEFTDQTQGMFGGLGIQVDQVNGWLTVIEPLPGTPAAEAGLISGDRIVEIEGESTKGITMYEAIKLLKGEPGTQVTISVARKGEADLFERTITRAIINTQAVETREIRMIDDSVGYIRLRDFTVDAAEEVETAILNLQDQGMKGLIFDLRDNVGGLLDVAVGVCELFLDEGLEIVSHRNNRSINKVYRSERPAIGDFVLVVLVNEFSASASEIVAGCIQDHQRGIIVGPAGHRTFGKGSVQRLIESRDLGGGALKPTTSRYYTPSGRSIEDEKGLLPDVFAQVTEDQRIAIRRAEKIGVLPPFLEGDAPEPDPQPTNEPITVESVFDDPEPDSPDAPLYDIELMTAYQCLKGAMVLNADRKEHYSLAPVGN